MKLLGYDINFSIRKRKGIEVSPLEVEQFKNAIEYIGDEASYMEQGLTMTSDDIESLRRAEQILSLFYETHLSDSANRYSKFKFMR